MTMIDIFKDLEYFFKDYKLPGGFRYIGKDGGPCKCAISKVIYNEPATIVFFDDGTKTVCKVNEDEKYNPEYGLMMCVLKKLIGSDSLLDALHYWVPEQNLLNLSPDFKMNEVVDLAKVRKKYRADKSNKL